MSNEQIVQIQSQPDVYELNPIEKRVKNYYDPIHGYIELDDI